MCSKGEGLYHPTGSKLLLYFITFFIQVPTLGLKIMTGYWTMSGQDDRLSRQTFSWSVILTGQLHGFQIYNWKH